MTKRIVVVGTGGAGLAAAVAAREAGRDVVVVSKTKRALASCTAYSAGIFTLACGGLSPEEHYERTMRTGCGVNEPTLVKILSNEGEQALRTLQGWGVGITFRKGMATVRPTAPNELMGGAGFLEELVSIAQRAGIRFVDWTVATSLKLREGRVAGVCVQDWRTGRSHTIDAGAVILATGGCGQLFSHTDNPARITGDGYALAWASGAVVRDMEFVQFYPVGWSEPGLPRWMADVGLVDFLRITDAEGNEFLKEALREWGFKDGREGNLYARDRCARLVAEKDRQGGVFAHLEDLTEEQWTDPYLHYCLTLDASFFKGLRRPVRLAPLEHYFCGGVSIDGDGRTTTKGLYACGEVTGGVDGANRVGGNALTNIVTFGLRAGKAAAAECEPATGQEGDCAAYDGFLPVSAKGEKPWNLRRELQQKAWEALGPIREPGKIREFLAFLSNFKDRKTRIEDGLDRLHALEMEGLHRTAMLVAGAALKRERSLGTHYRP